MVGGSNSGTFYAYPGSCWYWNDGYCPKNMTQKVVITGCEITAYIYNPSSSYGIIAGHPACWFERDESTLEITCDKSLKELFKGVASTKHGYIGLTDYSAYAGDVKFNGTAYSDLKEEEYKKISCQTIQNAVVGGNLSNGYSVAWKSETPGKEYEATEMRVYISGQINPGGITIGIQDWNTITKSNTSNENQVVLEAVESFEFNNNQENYSATLEAGKLTVNVRNSGTYGEIQLQVALYNKQGEMVACSSKVIAERAEDANDWTLENT